MTPSAEANDALCVASAESPAANTPGTVVSLRGVVRTNSPLGPEAMFPIVSFMRPTIPLPCESPSQYCAPGASQS